MQGARAVLGSLVVMAAALVMTGAPPRPHGLELVPLIALAPEVPWDGVGPAACLTPAPTRVNALFHCYTPADIAAAYGVDALHAEGATGAGQTIVIVDAYGSPTALDDLAHFSATFGLAPPRLEIIHADGTPAFNAAMGGAQLGWAGETSLDLQWAHAIAPDAQLVLVVSNPSETEGVQGFPNMFNGIDAAISRYPGAVVSQSFAATEQSFPEAGPELVARFDQVYRRAAAQGVTVVSASGDEGSAGVDKQGRPYLFPTTLWPASDPLVTAVGGTWLQYGWRWDPQMTIADFFLGCGGALDCGAPFLAFTTQPGARTEAVWREDYLVDVTGGPHGGLLSLATGAAGARSTRRPASSRSCPRPCSRAGAASRISPGTPRSTAACSRT